MATGRVPLQPLPDREPTNPNKRFDVHSESAWGANGIKRHKTQRPASISTDKNPKTQTNSKNP